MHPVLFITLILLPVLGLNGAHYHLSLEGAGTKDGMVWAHAFSADDLDRVVNDLMVPGDHLHIAPGVYAGIRIHIRKGGESGKPKIITGLDHGQGLPVFVSEWSDQKPDKGTSVIEFADGASHVICERLRIKGAMTGVHAPSSKTGTPRRDLVLRDIDVSYCRHGFYLSDCEGLELERCDLKRYTKHAFRLEAGCKDVLFKECTADCSDGDAAWEKLTESLPFGFFVNDKGSPNSRIRFEHCLARNNMMPHQTNAYKNGDGFVVEAGASEVSFSFCRAIRNQDGGYDVKAKDTRFSDCIGIGNSRTFRLWNGGTLQNCVAAWANVGLWSNGSAVRVENCTFFELTETAVLLDDDASAPVTITSSLIASCESAHEAPRPGMVILKNTLTSSAPNFVKPKADWDGKGDAMNSLAHPEHGYRNREPVFR